MNQIDTPSGLTAYYRGPKLDEGKLPTIFYFSLSGEESLLLSPYNQPAELFSAYSLRVFSFTLPLHGEGYDPKVAVDGWREQELKGNNLVFEFLDKAADSIDYLMPYIDDTKIAVSGLSRGAFIATHLAAKISKIKIILGFAPMTSFILEKDEKHYLDLNAIKDKLIEKTIRFYIGNRDLQVSTDKCFHFLREIVELQFDSGIRSPTVEFFMYPSVGIKGHGTPPHVFENGCQWLINTLY